ncbi:hypothetical protein CDAR_416611 [Caerostris darwini]|uniref:Uncharacterized protein n=1 Tax=Caerostris darwini TaxID=1538125 RepID=A0AAV4MIF0_9ARAC|nr:hypothetical protein CDAR_416611 [Caerostris darwini]
MLGPEETGGQVVPKFSPGHPNPNCSNFRDRRRPPFEKNFSKRYNTGGLNLIEKRIQMNTMLGPEETGGQVVPNFSPGHPNLNCSNFRDRRRHSMEKNFSKRYTTGVEDMEYKKKIKNRT